MTKLMIAIDHSTEQLRTSFAHGEIAFLHIPISLDVFEYSRQTVQL